MSYLVSVNGHYLDIDQLYPNGPIVSLNYDIVFDDDTGRVLYFNKYMPVYLAESPQKFAGYYPAEDFYFKNGEYINGSNNDEIKKFYKGEIFPDKTNKYPYLGFLALDYNRRVWLGKREIIKIGGVYKIKTKVVDFFTDMEKLDYYLDSENNEYTANQVIDSTEFINSVNGSVNEFDSDLANSNLIEYVQKITSQQFYNENQELESYDCNTPPNLGHWINNKNR